VLLIAGFDQAIEWKPHPISSLLIRARTQTAPSPAQSIRVYGYSVAMISSSVTGKEDEHSMSKSARNSRFLQALVQFAITVRVEQCGARKKITMVLPWEVGL